MHVVCHVVSLTFYAGIVPVCRPPTLLSAIFIFLSFSVPQLTAVNDKMAEYTSTPGAASLNAALMHTLQRHRDILQVGCCVLKESSAWQTLLPHAQKYYFNRLNVEFYHQYHNEININIYICLSV